MSIHVALNHVTHYRYDRLVTLSPQVVRLRPAPHCRTRISRYSLKVQPAEHFINWQQDPQANYLARLVFPDPTRDFGSKSIWSPKCRCSIRSIFSWHLHAEQFPFKYDSNERRELAPYLVKAPATPRVRRLSGRHLPRAPAAPSISSSSSTSASRSRHPLPDSHWSPACSRRRRRWRSGRVRAATPRALLVQLLRHLGFAARFVSGYLIQLVPDVKSLDGPSGPTEDFTDLHAWCEVYLPGAGWIGLDPTSGLLAGEGHIPLACTPEPSAAAPITGAVDECETTFEHA